MFRKLSHYLFYATTCRFGDTQLTEWVFFHKVGVVKLYGPSVIITVLPRTFKE
jgi:hypothetical protein